VEIFSENGVVQPVGSVSSPSVRETDGLESLCKRLLRMQPQSEPLLKRLLARSQRGGAQRAFAALKDGRCSACNMMLATARIQRVNAGEFINCASCMTFLYFDQS
jgi:predicted  nucleic acid-binding Zn-ribbon protein